MNCANNDNNNQPGARPRAMKNKIKENSFSSESWNNFQRGENLMTKESKAIVIKLVRQKYFQTQLNKKIATWSLIERYGIRRIVQGKQPANKY